MIYNEETYRLDTCLDELIDAIQQSNTYQDYQKAKQALQKETVQDAICTLDEAKYRYEKVERFEAYLKEAKQYKKEMLKAKRALDYLPEVVHFRQCETALQQLLDDIIYNISSVIDDEIMIEWGHPLSQKKCKGACHDGSKRT